MGKRCQRCGYELAGLPDTHACPECGLEYDAHSLFIRLGGRSHAGQNAIFGLALAAWLAYLGLSKGQSAGEWVPCVLLLLVVAWLGARRLLRTADTGRTLIINQSGIRLTHPDLKTETIPWSRFGRAEISWITGRFCLRDRAGRKILRCTYYQLGPYLGMREVARWINERAAIYSAMVRGEPNR